MKKVDKNKKEKSNFQYIYWEKYEINCCQKNRIKELTLTKLHIQLLLKIGFVREVCSLFNYTQYVLEITYCILLMIFLYVVQ